MIEVRDISMVSITDNAADSIRYISKVDDVHQSLKVDDLLFFRIATGFNNDPTENNDLDSFKATFLNECFCQHTLECCW